MRHLNTEGNGAGWLVNAPWPVKVLAIVGPTSAIALFLVYSGAKALPDIVAKLTAIETHMSYFQQTLHNTESKLEQLIRTQEQTCRRLSKSDAEREACTVSFLQK